MKKKNNTTPRLHLSLEREKLLHSAKTNKLWMASALLGLLIVAGAIDYFDTSSTLAKPSTKVEVVQSLHAAIDDTVDKVSTERRAEIDAQFMAYSARLKPVSMRDEEQRAEFMASSVLSEAEKSTVLAEVEAGNRRVAPITLWDNFDQDGDIVSIETSGLVIQVAIMHAPRTILVPYTPGEPLIIQGVNDGGGGITAAIETASGAVPLPIMAVGQTIALPLL